MIGVCGQLLMKEAAQAALWPVEGVDEAPALWQKFLAGVERVVGLATDPLAQDLGADPGQVGSRTEVARRLEVDPKTISNRLRRETGWSFRDFMHSCRVKGAKRLLEETELEAKEIAARLGFGSYRTFGRVLKNEPGVRRGSTAGEAGRVGWQGRGENTAEEEPTRGEW
jgi:AraC-like DNA-binding protein